MKFPNHRIVDAHAHLCDPVFDTDRPAVIKRARAAGVGAIIAVSENLSDERNEPANAVISINAIAEITNISKEEVMETVLDNTCRLFGNLNL